MSRSLIALSTATLFVLAAATTPLFGQGPPATPTAAVEQFIRAAADSNLTRMAELFGTDDGSVKATGKPEDYPKRMVVMQAVMGHTEVRVLSEVKIARDDHIVVTTEIAKGNCKVVIPITTVKADKGWLVREFDLPAVWDGINRPCVASQPGN